MAKKRNQNRSSGIFARVSAASACFAGLLGCVEHRPRRERESVTPVLAVRLIAATLLFAGTLLFCANQAIFRLLMLLSAAAAAYDVLWRAIRALTERDVFAPELLTCTAAAAAFLAGQSAAGAAAMLLFRLTGLAANYAAGRMEAVFSGRLRISTAPVSILRVGEPMDVSPAEICPGDTVLIPPGVQFPTNGVISRGRTTVDMTALAGQEASRSVAPGDAVCSGCVNQGSAVEYTATAAAQDSLAARILWAGRAALQTRGRVEAGVSRLFRLASAVLCTVALLAAVIGSAAAEVSFSAALVRVLPLLIAASPAALDTVGLAYHAAVCTALRQGVLFSSPSVLDDAAATETVVFNQTGTLTTGVFRVCSVISPRLDSDMLLQIAAHVEAGSTHPIARAIRAAYAGPIRRELIRDFSEIPGRGAQAVIDGIPVRVGNREFLMENGVVPDDSSAGELAVYLSFGGQYAGCIILSDSLKEQAAGVVSELRGLGIRSIIMLTGDSRDAAARTAKTAGITEYVAECRVEGKPEQIRRLRQRCAQKDGTLMCVGWGARDADSLAAADVGVSFNTLGHGDDDVHADIALMQDALYGVPLSIELARRTHRTVGLNLLVMLAVKLLILAGVMLGAAPLWAAVLLDGCASVFQTARCAGAFRAVPALIAETQK